MASPRVPSRVLVVGLGSTGEAMVRALTRRGHEVVVVDDHPSDAVRGKAESLGVDLVVAPALDQLDVVVRGVGAVLPSPGVPDAHPVFASARATDTTIMSEFDLAVEWDDRPFIVITGTDGKTTVTTMVTSMFEQSGLSAAAVGNTDIPFVAAIDDPMTDVFVVEASSFRLGHTRYLPATVATWLNFSPDHLDAHVSLEAYESAKARVWSDLGADGIAIANGEDPVVMRHVDPSVTTVTFGRDNGDYHVADSALVTPDGEQLVRVDELWRTFPHDLTNGLAAAATALAGGATLEGVRRGLREFRGLAHRVEFVGEWDGVRWFDDSKATAPHATLAAMAGFDSVVLVAGGRNKGLDLSTLASADQVRAVVAIGDAAGEVEAAFAGRRPVVRADSSMEEAVTLAAELATPGDAVVLSPGCSSHDWFDSYAQRGDVFVAAVRRIVGGEVS